jgi:phosphatidylglycerol:prolipoprotein diacylglycerol transferase
MLPILFKIGPVTIHTYGFMLALGVAMGLWFLYVQGKKQNMDAARLLDLAFYTIIISLIGAKLVLLVGNFSTYVRNPGQLFSLARSGGVFQGGLAFGILFALWYMRRHKIKVWKTADLLGPALALGHGFGRIGCFSAGCCYGRSCGLPWGVDFHNEYAHSITGIPLNTTIHPVQLYESALNFLNFLVLFVILKKKRFDGQVFLFYIINYSVIRYFTEFFRGDHADKTYALRSASPYLSISLPQLFAICGFIVGITLLFLKKKKRA